MFTGIITHMGQARLLSPVSKKYGGSQLRIAVSDQSWHMPTIGASVAVDGICLTITQTEGSNMAFDLSAETLAATTIGHYQEERRVNLECAMTYGDAIDGHFVSGHVDRAIRVLAVTETKDTHRVVFESPSEHAPYIIRKGSVCINGVSLTVNDITAESFDVNIIPHTLSHTNLSELEKGDLVNLETDILARYLANLLNQ